MKKKSKIAILVKVLGVALLLVSVGGGWLWMSFQQFVESPIAVKGQPAVFVLEPGLSVGRVGEKMKAQGFISDGRFFGWLARLDGKAQRLQAGEYELKAGSLPRDVLDLFVSGRVKQYSLTMVEGWTFAQVMGLVGRHPKIKQTLTNVPLIEVMAHLGRPGQHPEGRFLPDTYLFPSGTTDVEFLQRAYTSMQALLNKEWGTRAAGLPYKDAGEALIMASIVEKETGAAAERAEIAGVFVRRLQKGMKLQTDPTLIYGLGNRYDGNIHRSDLTEDTPYNTYTRFGLPPTPIALPGADAVRAALHPNAGNALYFVARGDGTHVFSATLEEHQRAVRRFQINARRSDYRSAPKVELK